MKAAFHRLLPLLAIAAALAMLALARAQTWLAWPGRPVASFLPGTPELPVEASLLQESAAQPGGFCLARTLAVCSKFGLAGNCYPADTVPA